MDGRYTALGAVAFAAVGVVVVSRPGVRSWAASARGRAWTRRVGVLAVLVAGAATGVFPTSPPQGVVVYFVAGVLAFLSGCLAAAGAAGAAEQRSSPDQTLGPRLRAFWRAAATEFRVTRYGLGVAGVAFLLAALTGGVAVDATLSAVGALSFGGLLVVLGGLTAVGALVPGSGRDHTGTTSHSHPADGEPAQEDTGAVRDAESGRGENGSGDGGSDDPPR